MSDNSRDDNAGNDFIEKRKYKRFEGNGSVHYFARGTGNWSDAELENYSAGGICFRSSETLRQDTKITIQIKRDFNSTVPAMAVSGVVVRCVSDGDHQYKIACKFNNTLSENPPIYLRLMPGRSY